MHKVNKKTEKCKQEAIDAFKYERRTRNCQDLMLWSVM